VSAEAFDIVEMRAQEGHALYLKGHDSGRLFRLSLVRDPAQPRLWCLLVERCATIGVNGRRLEAVLGPGGLTREEALTALHELGTNPANWLGDPRQRQLHGWLCSDAPGSADTADAAVAQA
jgi:hypothetical protein